jgi:uracil-DNA glycosylase
LQHIVLHDDWKVALESTLQGELLPNIRSFLQVQKKANKIIYPPSAQIFAALNMTPLSQVKVVIVGQDPYHGPGQAHGLAFSVNNGVPLPPSLRNIYKEVVADLAADSIPAHGDLSHWAQQGVLLLNSVLTVEAHQPASHQSQGWEVFTDAVLAAVSQAATPTVFLLWGNYAHQKGRLIDADKHLVIKSSHPSPLSANRGGFFGTKPFSKANDYLIRHHRQPINWL